MPPRCLVTGAAGFLGSTLIRRLANDCADVHGIMRPGSDSWRLEASEAVIHSLDLSDTDGIRKLVQDLRPQWIFHLAARGGHAGTTPDRATALADSVFATASLLEAATAYPPEHLVVTGSGLEHGWSRTAHVEEDAIHPVGYRGAVKACASLLCREFGLRTGVPVTNLRVYTVYGPFEQPRRFVPNAICAALGNVSLPLVDGNPVRDYVFAADVADALVRCAAQASSGYRLLNCASGFSTGLHEVVSLIESITGRHIQRHVSKATSSPIQTAALEVSNRKLRQTGWVPTPLETGLRQTIDWFSAIDRSRYESS